MNKFLNELKHLKDSLLIFVLSNLMEGVQNQIESIRILSAIFFGNYHLNVSGQMYGRNLKRKGGSL